MIKKDASWRILVEHILRLKVGVATFGGEGVSDLHSKQPLLIPQTLLHYNAEVSQVFRLGSITQVFISYTISESKYRMPNFPERNHGGAPTNSLCYRHIERYSIRNGIRSSSRKNMKIQCIKAYQVDLPLYEGSYNWSGGKSVSVFDSTIVSVETDVGVTGYGEVCPLGPFYLPAYATGARTGIAELAPHLIGEDPTQLLPLNQCMDTALKGHPYVKSGIDIACWDILGKISNQSVCTLLGGRYGADFMLYRAISQQSPNEMAAKVATYRAEGYRKFQLKVGGDPNTDIERIHAVAELMQPGDVLIADANTGWLMHEAARVVRGVRDVDVYIEQPCLSYEECLAIRQRTDHPFCSRRDD